ncbi:MAG: ABA4-like family protein [Chitinophagaceae bacterium]
MKPEQLFSVCNSLAMVAWIILIFFSFWKKRDTYLFAIVILLFALVYSWLIFSYISPDGFKNFNTLDGVSQLFSNKFLLLAGWVHYLAFDLLTGIYIVNNARKNRINHWVTAPALFFTFLLGPFGWLLYFIIRLVKTKRFIPDNF